MTLDKDVSERFDALIGKIPDRAIMQHYGKEFCVMCGHPTTADETVKKLKDLFAQEIERAEKRVIEDVLKKIDDWWEGKYVTEIQVEPLNINGRYEIPKDPLPTVDQYLTAIEIKKIIKDSLINENEKDKTL